MEYFVYLCDVDNLTKPVFVKSFKCESGDEAIKRAGKLTEVKRIQKALQTNRMFLRSTSKRIDFEKEYPCK